MGNGRQRGALGDFAADLGRFLGTVQSRASSWIDQRRTIAQQLTQIRDSANEYLKQLAAGELVTSPFRRRGRPPASAKAAAPSARSASAPASRSAPRRRTMSPEARARISEAQRKRWAKLRRKKKGAKAKGPGRGSEIGNG